MWHWLYNFVHYCRANWWQLIIFMIWIFPKDACIAFKGWNFWECMLCLFLLPCLWTLSRTRQHMQPPTNCPFKFGVQDKRKNFNQWEYEQLVVSTADLNTLLISITMSCFLHRKRFEHEGNVHSCVFPWIWLTLVPLIHRTPNLHCNWFLLRYRLVH